MRNVLVIDDEKSVRDAIAMILEYAKYPVEFAEDGPSGLARALEGDFDLVLLDIKMPGIDGMKVLEKIKETKPYLPVVMISGHATPDNAVEAILRYGAYDFLSKPLDRDRLLIVVKNATEYRVLKEWEAGRVAIIGQSPKILEVLSLIDRVAPTDSRVLITGENGSGKELVAKAIHRRSRRADRPLVAVNCAAIPNELIESELFGHEKGAFTGAVGQRAGRFELADGGTLFLDEIGDMSLGAQSKVLRALEEGTIERVGGAKQIGVNVRVIAATNRNLPEMIRQGMFREDLYHRLSVIPLRVPPLRERREDIPLLTAAFVEDLRQRDSLPRKEFEPEAMRRLQEMPWPGNVRELRNVVERLVIMSHGSVIRPADLEPVPAGGGGTGTDDLIAMGGTFQEFKDRAEAAFIRHQLAAHGWNISRTAEALDIQRSHLYNKMKKFGLEREEGSEGSAPSS